jgi:hypothetical protein
MPFQYTPYRNQYVGSITDLMGRGRDAEAQALITAANAQAQAAQISGQAWGGAVQGIGNTIAAIPGQMQAQQDREMALKAQEADIGYTQASTNALIAEDRRRITDDASEANEAIRINAVFGNPDWRPEDFVAAAGTERGLKIAEAWYGLQNPPTDYLSPDEQGEYLRKTALGFNALPDSLKPEKWAAARQALLDNPNLRIPEGSIPIEFDQVWLNQSIGFGQDPAGSTQGGAGTDYRSYLERVAQGLGIPVAELTAEQELAARRQFTTAGSSLATQQGRDADRETARVIADAVCRGEQPPTLTGLRKYTGLVREEMAKLGCDLTESTQDWNAINKHISTLNSAGQLRMRQATTFAYHSLDLVEKFAKEWDAGQFPALNNVRMESAMAGALGPEAQRIATNLNSTITDLVSELATVYRGGLSSTDSSIALAAENLKTEWSKEVLLSGIQLMRDTLQIRLNSINTTDVAGTPYNRYSRTAVPGDDVPAGGVEMRDRQQHTDPATGETFWIIWDENEGAWFRE